MEEILENLINLNISDIKVYAIVPILFIFTDIATGYIKAFKNKKVNSSIGRDGFCKKLGWVVAIILGYIFYFFLNTNLVLMGTAIYCSFTELTSIYENLADIGVNVPFKQFFEKVDKGE